MDFLLKKFMYSRFSEVYLSLLNYSKEYIDQQYNLDNFKFLIDYDQLNIHMN